MVSVLYWDFSRCKLCLSQLLIAPEMLSEGDTGREKRRIASNREFRASQFGAGSHVT